MDFSRLVIERQSCRKYEKRAVEREKIDAILEAARLSPSACNGQPYHITVCHKEKAMTVARACMSMGMNKFAADAPLMIVISEENYAPSAAFGAKVKHNDYRSIDIGILSASITYAAADLGLGSCIIGWLDDEAIRGACGLDKPVRLVIAVGYPLDAHRDKKRKSIDDLVTEIE